jgi:hypothetical protein
MIEFGNFKPDPSSSSSSSASDQSDLSISDNYLSDISCDASYVLEKYSILLFEYMLLFFEKIKIMKNNHVHFRYIFERGLKTVTSVFIGLIEYTKNVDLSFNLGKKAFYFYIEFIEQISDAQNSFLQLTSRDAIMFVYKRTIFDVNKEMVKPSTSDNQIIMKLLSNFHDICKTCSYHFIQNVDLNIQPIQINGFVISLNSSLSDVKKMDLTKSGLLLKQLQHLQHLQHLQQLQEEQLSIPTFLDHFAGLVEKTRLISF